MLQCNEYANARDILKIICYIYKRTVKKSIQHEVADKIIDCMIKNRKEKDSIKKEIIKRIQTNSYCTYAGIFGDSKRIGESFNREWLAENIHPPNVILTNTICYLIKENIGSGKNIQEKKIIVR